MAARWSPGWRQSSTCPCATRTLLNKIYAQPAAKRSRPQIDKALVDVMVFIRHIRGRIEQYVAFGHQMLEYLAAQKRAHPELTVRLAELARLTREIDARFILFCLCPESVQQLSRLSPELCGLGAGQCSRFGRKQSPQLFRRRGVVPQQQMQDRHSGTVLCLARILRSGQQKLTNTCNQLI